MKHEGLRTDRLTNGGPSSLRERAFAETWARTAEAVLHYLITPNGGPTVYPTAHDDEVIASIIQWLGTNTGQAFLRNVEDTYETLEKASRVRVRIDQIEKYPCLERISVGDQTMFLCLTPLKVELWEEKGWQVVGQTCTPMYEDKLRKFRLVAAERCLSPENIEALKEYFKCLPIL